VLEVSFPLLDGPGDSPPGEGGGGVLPAEAAIVPRSEAIVPESCNNEPLINEVRLSAAAVALADPVSLADPVALADPPLADPRPRPNIISMKLMLLDNGEAVLGATGLTTDGSAAVVPALLKPHPPFWTDCAAGGGWSAASCAHRSFCPDTEWIMYYSPLLMTGGACGAGSVPSLESWKD
jgi:hypothetical protein